MSRNRPVDEWGRVIQKQVEHISNLNYEEGLRQARDRSAYKDSLQYQTYLKQLQRAEEHQERLTDFRDIQHRVTILNKQEELRKTQETSLKKHLAEEYQHQQLSTKQRSQDQRAQEQREERVQLERVKQQQQEDERRKFAQKRRMNQEQQEILSLKKQQHEQELQQVQKEKVQDQRMQEARNVREEQKEREYRDYYHRLSQSQTQKVYKFDQALAPKNERDFKIASWIDKNFYEQQTILARKEDYERQMRENNIKQMSEALRTQVEHKERAKQYLRREQQQESEQVARSVQFTVKQDQEREQERRVQQALYKEQLQGQATNSKDLQLGAYRLSEAEKRMNRHILDEPRHSSFQRSAAQIVRPSARNYSFDEDTKNWMAPGRRKHFSINE